MDSDRDFGLIEQRLSKVDRVHSPDEYRELIKSVKPKNPFVVQNIAGGLINAKKLANALHLVKRLRNTKKEKVEFRNIRWLKIDQLGYFKYRLSFDPTEDWKLVDIRGRSFSPTITVDLSSPQLVLAAGRPIMAAKASDIRKQLPFIPRIYHGFYNSIAAVEDYCDTNSSANSIVSDGESE